MAKSSQPEGGDPETAFSATAFAAPPRGRASWSGLLQLSLVSIPIKAYPAVSSSDRSHFHQLHADCGQRIQYQKHCPLHGLVDAGAIVRGYQYAPGQHLVVEPAELDRLRPAKDRALRLERFIDPQQLDPVRFTGRSLYLLPDGLAAQHAYDLLCTALGQRGQWAVGRVVFTGQRQLVVVRPAGTIFVTHVLHYAEQVRARPAEPSRRPDRPAAPEELQLVGQIIDAASGGIDWCSYRDESAEELRALVEAKLVGRPSAEAEAPATLLPLLDALKQSVAATGHSSTATPTATAKPTRKHSRKTA